MIYKTAISPYSIKEIDAETPPFSLASALHEWYRPNSTDVGTTATAVDTGSVGGLNMTNPTAVEEPTLVANYINFNGTTQGVKKTTSNFRSADTSGAIHFKFNYTSGNTTFLFSISNSTNNDFIVFNIQSDGKCQMAWGIGGVFTITRTTNVITSGVNTVSFFRISGSNMKIIINGSIQTLYDLNNIGGNWISKYYNGGGAADSISMAARYVLTPFYTLLSSRGGWYSQPTTEVLALSEHNDIKNNA